MKKIRVKKAPRHGDQFGYGLYTNDFPNVYSGKDEIEKPKTTIGKIPKEEANAEVEGGEFVIGDLNADGFLETFSYVGPTHTKGGINAKLTPDSFIFSNSKDLVINDEEVLKEIFDLKPRKKGYTPGDIAKRFNINEHVAVIKDPDADKFSKGTAVRMMQSKVNLLGHLALIQEEMKGFPKGVPAIAKAVFGDDLNLDTPVDEPQEEGLEQFAKGGQKEDPPRKYKNERERLLAIEQKRRESGSEENPKRVPIKKSTSSNPTKKYSGDFMAKALSKNQPYSNKTKFQEALDKYPIRNVEDSELPVIEGPFKIMKGQKFYINDELYEILGEEKNMIILDKALPSSGSKTLAPIKKVSTSFLRKAIKEGVFNIADPKEKYDGNWNKNIYKSYDFHIGLNPITRKQNESAFENDQFLATKGQIFQEGNNTYKVISVNGRKEHWPNAGNLTKKYIVYEDLKDGSTYHMDYDEFKSKKSQDNFAFLNEDGDRVDEEYYSQKAKNEEIGNSGESSKSSGPVFNPETGMYEDPSEATIGTNNKEQKIHTEEQPDGPPAYYRPNTNQTNTKRSPRTTTSGSTDRYLRAADKGSRSYEYDKGIQEREDLIKSGIEYKPTGRIQNRNSTSGIYINSGLKGDLTQKEWDDFDSRHGKWIENEYVSDVTGEKGLKAFKNDLRASKESGDKASGWFQNEANDKLGFDYFSGKNLDAKFGRYTFLAPSIDALNTEDVPEDEMPEYAGNATMEDIEAFNAKKLVADPETPDGEVERFRKPDGGWYLQDRVNFLGALTDQVNRYSPMLQQLGYAVPDYVLEDPTRQIAAIQEAGARLGSRIENTQSGPSGLAVEMGLSGRNLSSIADVIGQTENRNANIVNQNAIQRSSIVNENMETNSNLQSTYVAQKAIENQQFDNAMKSKKWDVLNAFKDGTTNWHKKKLMEQALFPQFIQDPITGDMSFSGVGKDYQVDKVDPRLYPGYLSPEDRKLLAQARKENDKYDNRDDNEFGGEFDFPWSL